MALKIRSSRLLNFKLINYTPDVLVTIVHNTIRQLNLSDFDKALFSFLYEVRLFAESQLHTNWIEVP